MGLQTDDLCAGFFNLAWDAGRLPLAPGATVLEIGCAEYDWIGAFKALRPDVQTVGIDWRCRGDDPQRLKADVLTYDFPPAFFDAIVSISTIEHLGLGAYDADPLDVDGDTHAMQRAWTWLKPGGWLYCDVPYRPNGPYRVVSGYRAYDPAAHAARLTPVNAIETWRELCEAEGHGDAPYLAIVWQKPKDI